MKREKKRKSPHHHSIEKCLSPSSVKWSPWEQRTSLFSLLESWQHSASEPLFILGNKSCVPARQQAMCSTQKKECHFLDLLKWSVLWGCDVLGQQEPEAEGEWPSSSQLRANAWVNYPLVHRVVGYCQNKTGNLDTDSHKEKGAKASRRESPFKNDAGAAGPPQATTKETANLP